LRAFLASAPEEWLEAAPSAAARIHFTGRIEHDDVPALLPVCEALVMPSTFPEAFGMVAVEAAACGVLPLSAGMAEVTAALAPALSERADALLRSSKGKRLLYRQLTKLMTLKQKARAFLRWRKWKATKDG
jgi:glycosyltransferase involved in cell wall biosynthesis